MEENTQTEKKSFWNFIDNFKGDKVIWMIVLLLILISLVTIFSSASGLVAKGDSTRIDIFISQFKLVCVGLLLIIACYNIPSIGFIKWASQLGFPLSVALLFCLIFGIGAGEINGARRILVIGGFQVHIFEIIKVAMVMYLAWAIHTYKEDGFWLTNWLSNRYERLSFLKKPLAKRIIYVYLPILIVCGGMFRGGISSSLFTMVVMFLTILIGGMPKKEIFGAAGIAICVIGLFTSMYFVSDGKHFKRIGVAVQRLTMSKEYEAIRSSEPGSDTFRRAMDKIRQPEGAKIAVMEGGLVGKGPGNSTQKYSVYAIFSDYMYSFIIEEYGLMGGIIILILYASLLARGSLIVKYCGTHFSKTAVAGLVLLISGQALMHMIINVDIGPLTGQTLPMISHGSSSFFSFSIAFGILLSISKLAKKQMDERRLELEMAEANEAALAVVTENDGTEDGAVDATETDE